MKIGIDLDQTLYHLDVIEHASKMLGLNFKSEDVKYWDYDNKNNLYPSYFTYLVFQLFGDPKYMGGLQLNPNSKEKLLYWKSKGYELYIITARLPSVVVATIECLNRDFGEGFFEGIYFVEHEPNAKQSRFIELKLDVWIDDNANDLLKAHEMGIDTYAIYSKYTKYNRTIIDQHDDIIKIKNLGDIKQLKRKKNGIKYNNWVTSVTGNSAVQYNQRNRLY